MARGYKGLCFSRLERHKKILLGYLVPLMKKIFLHVTLPVTRDAASPRSLTQPRTRVAVVIAYHPCHYTISFFKRKYNSDMAELLMMWLMATTISTIFVPAVIQGMYIHGIPCRRNAFDTPIADNRARSMCDCFTTIIHDKEGIIANCKAHEIIADFVHLAIIYFVE